ncbi:hypothetical protein IJI72_02620 [Candidatus Saccharibacteria bacterium]|nr:hypothetical protein [Candidatus Saccharibacteria bacterium]
MLKSSKIVLCLGVLLGGSVAVLPTKVRATRAVDAAQVEVSLTLPRLLALEMIGDGVPGTSTGGAATTWNSTTNAYSASFNVSDHSDATHPFGTTHYNVTCNYLAAATPTSGSETAAEQAARLADDCSHGWLVSVAPAAASGGYAAMTPSNNSNAARIKSNSSNGLSGASSNWLLKIAGVAKTTDASGATVASYSPTPETAFNNQFGTIPASSGVVVTGNTFSDNGDDTYTYLGDQQFDAIYGVSAGTDVPADTYTGTLTYTLAIRAAN